MSNIVDYVHTLYYFGGIAFSFFDFFRSEEWMTFVRHGKGEVPLNEGLNLLSRLAEQKGFPVDVSLFGGIICGDVDPDEGGEAYRAFAIWKQQERPSELKRILLMDRFLSKNRCYPYVLYPLFNQRYTSTEKAQQLYSTLNAWIAVKRPFFKLVFKYSKRLGAQVQVAPDLNVLQVRDRKKIDPLYDVYVEAANALWDYADYLEDKVEIVGRRQKKRDGSIFNAVELEHEWVEWMGWTRRFALLLEYHRRVINKQRERARFTVFMEFLWMYLKRDNLINDPTPTKRGKSREQHLKIRKEPE